MRVLLFLEMFKILTVGPGHVSTRGQRVSATRLHAGATQAPRRRHARAAVSGLPAVAGGERRHSGVRGWARSNEGNAGYLLGAAPLAGSRRSNDGERARAAAATVVRRGDESEGEEARGRHRGAHREARSAVVRSTGPEEQRRRWNRRRRRSDRRGGRPRLRPLGAFPAGESKRRGGGDDGESNGGLKTARGGGYRRRRQITAAERVRVSGD